jgi:glycine cleavage system regulatory protein
VFAAEVYPREVFHTGCFPVALGWCKPETEKSLLNHAAQVVCHLVRCAGISASELAAIGGHFRTVLKVTDSTDAMTEDMMRATLDVAVPPD